MGWRRAPSVEPPLPAVEIDELVRDAYRPRLEARGFGPVDRRRWVRSDKAPIREAIGIRALKGYSFVPTWSISLDFVPHVTAAGRVAWHRTATQARRDLGVDPLDHPTALGADRLVVPGMRRRDVVRRAFERSAALATALAEEWFGRISDVPSLVAVFEDAERGPSERFGFDDHVQHRLAFAFVLAHCGDRDRALAELDRWCHLHVDEPSLVEQLHQLISPG